MFHVELFHVGEKNVVLPDVCNVITISELFDVSADYLLKSKSVHKRKLLQ